MFSPGDMVRVKPPADVYDYDWTKWGEARVLIVEGNWARLRFSNYKSYVTATDFHRLPISKLVLVAITPFDRAVQSYITSELNGADA